MVELWDERKLLGSWYARHPDYLNGGVDVYWDAYALYGAGSRWTDKPSDLVSWGHTIAARREQLRRDLQALLRARKAPSIPQGDAAR